MKFPKLRQITLSLWFGSVGTLAFNDLGTAATFPIATNASVVEFGGGMLFDGTNYLAGLLSGTNVILQRFSANGALLGPPVTVGSNPGFPPIVGFARGETNFLVVWSDHSINSGVDLIGQFVSRGGVKVGSPFNVLSAQGTHGFQTQAALASDGTNFMAVWQDENNRNFYGQMVTPAGTLSGSEFLISSQLQNGTSAAATFGKTNYLVVWQSSNGSEGDVNKTYGAFVSRSGGAGTPIQISQSTSPSHNPLAVAFDGTNYLAAWNRDLGLGYPAPTDWDFWGRLVSPEGTFPGNEVGLVTDAGDQVLPALAFDGANYLLAWGDGSFSTTNATIRFRFFDRSASAVGPSFTLFSAHETDAPLSPFGSLLFDGSQFVVAGTLGTVQMNSNGNVIGFLSGDVYGGVIARSTAPPRLDTVGSLMGSQFPLRLTGTPGINYVIQTSTSVSLASWAALTTNSPTNGIFSFTDPSATNRSRFYRAVKQ